MDNSLSFPANVSLRGRKMRSMEEAIQFLHRCSRDEVYPLAMQIQAELIGVIESSEDNLCTLHEFVHQGEFWRGHEEDEDSFRSSWQAARDALVNRTKRLEYIESIREKSIRIWGGDNAKALFLRVKTRAMAEKVSRLLSTNLDYQTIRLMINNEIVIRLSTKSRGIKREMAVMQGDLAKAFSNRCQIPLSVEKFQDLGLGLDEDGYCCPIMSGRALEYELKSESDSDLSNDSDPNGLYPGRGRESSYGSQNESSATSSCSSESENEYRRRNKRKRNEFSRCYCPLSHPNFRRILSQRELKNDRKCQRLLQKVGHKISVNYGRIDTHTLCSAHSRRICSMLGMLILESHEERTYRLEKLYHGLDSWESTRAQYSDWFRQSRSNGIASGNSTMFRFHAKNIRPIVENWDNLKHMTLQGLYQRCFGKNQPPSLKRIDNHMRISGSVVVPRLFDWLKHDFDGKHPGGIHRLALLEFSMYDWHFRPHSGDSRLGFAKNMWYSLIQQLVRQDIVYWMWHVYLRPDHLWRLISVPCYARSTYPGETTYSQGSDDDVGSFLSVGYSRASIQDSVSLDDEDEENCDELLYGMNRYLQDSWYNTRSREPRSEGNIRQFVSENWTIENRERYGIDWVKQICQATDVRFSHPDLPCRPTNPATAQRHTISACFVGIKDDHSGLDITGSGTWEELSRFHRDFIPSDMISEKETNGGEENKEMSAFAGIVRLSGLGPISDALVGKERWTNMETIHVANLLFGSDESVAQSYIQDWRENAFKLYIAAYDRMVEAEKVTYGENSFFNRMEAGLGTMPTFVQDIDTT